MNLNDIKEQYDQLSEQLKNALSTMEKKDDIFQIYQQLINLQNSCPHFNLMYNRPFIDGHCPYCGKLIGEENKNEN